MAIAHGLPNGDSTPLDWTTTGSPHYEQIIDGSDLTYVQTTVANQKETFDCNSAGVTGALSVSRITVNVRAWSGHGTTFFFRIFMGGVWETAQSYEVPWLPLQPTLRLWDFDFDFDGTWTQADLDALQIQAWTTSTSGSNQRRILELSYDVTYVPGVVPGVTGIEFNESDAVQCLISEGITPSTRPSNSFQCRMYGVISFADEEINEFEVTVRSEVSRGVQRGFIVENPYPEESTLAFRRLCKDKLAEVQAIFDELCSGATLYGDTTVLDELPEKPVSDFTFNFTGNVSFTDGGHESFNVVRSVGVGLDTVPDNVGDETFTQLLQDAQAKTAIEDALNQIT